MADELAEGDREKAGKGRNMLTKQNQSAFKSKHRGAAVTTQPNICGDEDGNEVGMLKDGGIKMSRRCHKYVFMISAV